MENKRIKELLIQVKKELIDKKTNYNHRLGICNVINKMYERDFITEGEYTNLSCYLKDNKPSDDNQYSEFTKDEHWIGTTYWWTKMCYSDYSRIQRIKFLRQLIRDVPK